MMRVVVVGGCPLEHAEKLHAPVRAGKRLQRGGDVVETDADLERHRGGGGRVLDVVAAGLPQGDVSAQDQTSLDGKWTRSFTPRCRVTPESGRDLAWLGLEVT